MNESILTSTKRLLGIEEDYEHFDPELIIHINSVFSTLHQLGVGPQARAYMITSKENTWDEFVGAEDRIEAVKSYMYLRVRLLFDPPSSGYTTTSFENQIKELEWRLNVAVDPGKDVSVDDDTDILAVLYNNAVNHGYTGTYEEWLEKFNGEGSGTARLSEDLIAAIGVGGIKLGDGFTKGELLESLWRHLLTPVSFPTIAEPSTSISASVPLLLEAGEEKEVTFTVQANRGSISPPFGTSGYRAGELVDGVLYLLDKNGNTLDSNTTGQFKQTVSETSPAFRGSACFAMGEQPKDSAGDDYSSPYDKSDPVLSSLLTFEFVDRLWSNAKNNSVVEKEELISKSAKSKVFEFSPQTKDSPEIFDVPASWNITAVEVLNEVTLRYEDDSAEFDKSPVIHQNAAGTNVDYIRYADNRGYAASSRSVKITWS